MNRKLEAPKDTKQTPEVKKPALAPSSGYQPRPTAMLRRRLVSR
jgi:hypothetical protein